MSKKPLSNMTAQRFVEITGALGGRFTIVARLLGLSPAMVSRYANGHSPIPVEVVTKLQGAIQDRIATIDVLKHSINISEDLVSQLIVVANETKEERPKRLPFLMRRGNDMDTRVYPAYRLRHADLLVYAESLSCWHAECVTRRQKASDARDIRALDLELADLKVLAGNLQGIKSKGAPYNMYITFSEWFVVSRALRWQVTDRKYAIYQHWRHHKGPGFPRARSSPTNGQTDQT